MAGKVPVFDILERKAFFSFDVVPMYLQKIRFDLTVKKVRRDSIVYTDKKKSYDSPICCRYQHLTIYRKRYLSSDRFYINSNSIEGFWFFAKGRFIRCHGVSKSNFPLYLKRWNSDTIISINNAFEILVNYPTDFWHNFNKNQIENYLLGYIPITYYKHIFEILLKNLSQCNKKYNFLGHKINFLLTLQTITLYSYNLILGLIKMSNGLTRYFYEMARVSA